MTVCAVISLAILVMLGNWQWQRYQEKQANAAAVIEWVAFDGDRVVGGPFYVSTILNGQSAWRVVLAVDAGADVVLISEVLFYGIEPPDLASPNEALISHDEGVFATPTGPNRFTPAPNGNRLFSYDVRAIADQLDAEAADRLSEEVYEPRELAIFDETGGGDLIPNPWADPVLADPLPPARHLGYALTWWGMGIALLVMYLVFHINAGRLRFGTQG